MSQYLVSSIATVMGTDYLQNPYEGAHDTCVAIDDTHPSLAASDVCGPTVFTNSHSLLRNPSIERYGQITPPGDLFPTKLCHVTAMQERSEVAILDVTTQFKYPFPSPPASVAKCRRVSTQAAAIHIQPNSTSHQTTTESPILQPSERRRGRSKVQPKMAEACTGDDYHISLRRSRIENNRVAAHKCRQRKKAYIDKLEAHDRELSATNKVLKGKVTELRDDVLHLKNELIRHAGCGFWMIDEYLAHYVGDLVGVEHPKSFSTFHFGSRASSPILHAVNPGEVGQCTWHS